jgi:hypothetical protein
MMRDAPRDDLEPYLALLYALLMFYILPLHPALSPYSHSGNRSFAQAPNTPEPNDLLS